MSTLRVNQIQTDTGKPILNSTGSIIQVVHVAKSDSFTGVSVQTGTGYYIDVPGLSASITPSSSSNRILILTNLYVGASTEGAPGYQVHFRIKRNGSPFFFSPIFEGVRPASAGTINMYTDLTYDPTSLQYRMSQLSGVHYDSPASTSSVTYQIALGRYSGSPTVYLNRSQIFQNAANDYDSVPTSTLTLMEVSA
jgi:hypothetical protein